MEEWKKEKEVVTLFLAAKELHGLSSLCKLIKESENNTIQWTTENGSAVQIELEKLARYLPLHLIARVKLFARNEASFRYLLSGFQLLYYLCDQASRNSKLEQVLLDDVKVSEQLFDLTIYMLNVLGGFKQERLSSSRMALLHSALVSCSLFLLRVCISSQWQELVQMLLVHPKVQEFMNVAFAAVRINTQFLQIKLSDQRIFSCTDSSNSERDILNHLTQHCEASLQFLQSLCQQKLFRELAVKNKELCEKGGILLLAQDIMKLHIVPSYKEPSLVAAISRLKAKVLSLLLHLCEVESTSYLDEVASTNESLGLANSVTLEVVALLKTIFGGDPKEVSESSNKAYPRGLLQLNAMRFVDILSDDSNFRSHVTVHFTEVLGSIFSLTFGEFLSSWCSSEVPASEEDATLEYDPLAAAQWVLDFCSSKDAPTTRNSECTFSFSHVPKASYAHQRTALMVKVIANLHCHVPEICNEEKDIFLNRFLNIMKTKYIYPSEGSTLKSAADKADSVRRNLRSLLSHAESLIPGYLNEDDSQLLRVFICQIEPLIDQRFSGIDRVQGAQRLGRRSSPMPINSSPDNYGKSGDLNDDMSESSAVEEVDQLDVKGNDQQEDAVIGGSNSNTTIAGVGFGGVEEDVDKVEKNDGEEKQPRKRKRTIMNDNQVSMIEKALIDEPNMQRKKAALDMWANTLSRHGSEVTASQLKNWLNNRKARLLRTAAKDDRGPSILEKQASSGVGDHNYDDSPTSPVEDPCNVPSTFRAGGGENENIVQREPGQYVRLLDEQGEEIGKGYVYQSNGTWAGKNLEDSGTCVVDITNLGVDKWEQVPYPCEATGTSFAQAENLLGSKRVLWDSNKLVSMHHPR